MKKSVITAKFSCDIKKVWNIVTDNSNYVWRSDLSKIKVIDDTHFDEYTKEGYVTHFQITVKKPYEEYRLLIENKNMNGRWKGRFTDCDEGTQITFIEEVDVKNPVMNLFVKIYLKKQQERYIADLRKALEERE